MNSREKGISSLRIYQSSYSDWNLFWDTKILRTQGLNAIYIINSPKKVLKHNYANFEVITFNVKYKTIQKHYKLCI